MQGGNLGIISNNAEDSSRAQFGCKLDFIQRLTWLEASSKPMAAAAAIKKIIARVAAVCKSNHGCWDKSTRATPPEDKVVSQTATAPIICPQRSRLVCTKCDTWSPLQGELKHTWPVVSLANPQVPPTLEPVHPNNLIECLQICNHAIPRSPLYSNFDPLHCQLKHSHHLMASATLPHLHHLKCYKSKSNLHSKVLLSFFISGAALNISKKKVSISLHTL